ncbi:hypothetical protein O0L34_g14709 [Tuta absoluta]|nr:hypothetical protein O0L34_g14709 [Tuta absoluta]
MNLQRYLELAFSQWQPEPPEVIARSKYDVTLSWPITELGFLAGELLYRIERKEKLPPWVVEYCGGRTTKRIENLAPCCPHKFRLKVIIKSDSVKDLAQKAVELYGKEEIALETIKNGLFKGFDANVDENLGATGDSNIKNTKFEEEVEEKQNIDEGGDTQNKGKEYERIEKKASEKKLLESKWSELMCTSTEPVGTSAVCFCMAVRGGYIKHVQSMLDERPELVGIINNTDGFTPLVTAITRGDLVMAKLLLSSGAEVDQRSTSGQTPLHIAVLTGNIAMVNLLLEKGADFQARDKNNLRVEHYAADAGNLDMLRHILDLGGDVAVQDNNKWTPLFRAVIQGSSTSLIEELLSRGSDLDIVDRAGLTVPIAARLLANRHGKPRHSVLMLVDEQYPHEKAVANFTRLTKKISSVHSLCKPNSPVKQTK